MMQYLTDHCPMHDGAYQQSVLEVHSHRGARHVPRPVLGVHLNEVRHQAILRLQVQRLESTVSQSKYQINV